MPFKANSKGQSVMRHLIKRDPSMAVSKTSALTSIVTALQDTASPKIATPRLYIFLRARRPQTEVQCKTRHPERYLCEEAHYVACI
jgi:hypothetical protein